MQKALIEPMDVTFLACAFREDHYPPSNLPEVAFAGRSNVGKSSLINCLVNRKGIARTSSTPGRTQSVNFFQVNAQLLLVDLPGYGFAKVPASIRKSWQAMVESYLRNRVTLRAVVVILDVRRGLTAGDMELIRWLHHYRIPSLPVLTKVDKVSRQQAARQTREVEKDLAGVCAAAPMLFSARTREGRDLIWQRIRKVAGIDPRTQGSHLDRNRSTP